MKTRALSAVAIALSATPIWADTTIDSSTSTALTTGALLTDGVGTANAGNIIIDSGGAVSISKTTVGAITIDTSNYLYSDGTIANNNVTTAYGVHVDVSANPDLSAVSFTNASSTTISGAGMYFDASSALNLTGSSNTGKYGIYFDTTNGSGTYTGDVTFLSGSTVTIAGASSYGVYFGSGTTFKGDLTFGSGTTVTMTGNSSYGVYAPYGSVIDGNISFGGTFTMEQGTATSTSSSGIYGLLLGGEVDGNVYVPSGGTLEVIGENAVGMSIQGTGVKGSVVIGGTLEAIGYTGSTTTSTGTTITNYPEAGTALAVGASVEDGIAVLGAQYSGDSSVSSASVLTYGTSPAFAINPGLNSSVTQSSSLVIGVYNLDGTADVYNPGFSVYNRGSITATPMNTNASASAVYMVGSAVYPTILTGGLYNSGGISASVTTSGTSASASTALALNIGAYTYLDNASFSTATGSWTDTSLEGKNASNQAALVNSSVTGSGKIAASVSGTRSGFAEAIYIAQNASVPSLINSGTISASATTTDQTLKTAISSSNTYTMQAVAIRDLSGTLTSIYNTGTISAQAGYTNGSTVSALDNDNQSAIAIDLSSGNTASPSGSGVTITTAATGSNAAEIVGDILFGTGDNQVINVSGTSSTYLGSIIGNISYGSSGTNAVEDQLNIGAYGVVSGKITAGSGPGVAVDIATNGQLYLTNSTTALNAASVHVANNGVLALGVSETLTSYGVIESQGEVTLDKGSVIGLSYNSFIPQGSHDYVLITAPYGELSIDPNTITVANTSLTKNVSDSGALPYLFQAANLEQTSNATTGDTLVLHVTPKTASQLGLTGYAAQLFPYANAALSSDDTLGAAMINGIHNTKEAQSAYAAFAPNVTGGDRAIAISITDQATGVVAARQRSLLAYGREEGTMSLWFDEFAQMIKDPGTGPTQSDGTRTQSGFKDHGFGFSFGLDSGTPKSGWYGAALTFYTGDVNELQRASHTNEQWYILSGYSVWRGKGLFFNSKVDVGYGHFTSKRYITLQNAVSTTTSSGTAISSYTREADSKHTGALLSGGFSTGAIFNYGATTFTPQLSVDGLLMREDPYTESNPGTATTGDAFDLKVDPYYAKSLRFFLGTDVRYDVDLWDYYLQPEARLGYRYDVFNDPQKLKVAFAYADTSGATATAGEKFTITGPDPAQGNLVLGGSLSVSTGTWALGAHYDFIRGTNGAVEQVGTFSLNGRF